MPKKKVVKKPEPVPGKMRRFVVEFAVTIDVKQEIIDIAMSDDWRKTFYDLKSPTEVAEFLAFNLMRNIDLTQLDGFADRANDEAVHVRTEDLFNTDEVPIPKPKKKR